MHSIHAKNKDIQNSSVFLKQGRNFIDLIEEGVEGKTAAHRGGVVVKRL